MLNTTRIHKSWKEFFEQEKIQKMIEEISLNIGTNIVPKEENVFRFASQDLSKVKCIWLGQDPYYTMYNEDTPVANGRSFQPDDLNNWNEKFSQKSLQNIIRLIYKNYNNIQEYDDIKKFSIIREEINSNDFKILQPKEWFTSLEQQGVLFLNTYLTTIPHVANKHEKYWKEFSKELLKYISEKNPNIYWFLWGDKAINNKQYIKGIVYESNHPTFCSKKYETDFLKSNCFKDTMNVINWLG